MKVSAFRAADGRLRAGWRYLAGVALAVLVNIANSQTFGLMAPTQARAAFRFTLMLAVLVFGYSWMSRRLDRATAPLAYTGLSAAAPWARQIAVGFVYGGAMVGIALVTVRVVGGEVQFVPQISASTLGTAVARSLVFAAAALYEEVGFRGYPFQRLIEGLGEVPAVLVLSIMFALRHANNPNVTFFALFNTIAVGVLFATAYLLTRTLWLVWGIHWGWNFALGVLFGLPVSGFEISGPVRGSVRGAAWLTGGNYGVEAGASGTLAVVAGFVGLFWLVHRRALVGPRAPLPEQYVSIASTAVASAPQTGKLG